MPRAKKVSTKVKQSAKSKKTTKKTTNSKHPIPKFTPKPSYITIDLPALDPREMDPYADLVIANTFVQKYPKIANAIQWQFAPADYSNAYASPGPACKIAFPQWTDNAKVDLIKMARYTAGWLRNKVRPWVRMDPNGLTDEPMNVDPGVGNDNQTAMQCATPSYMWQLYIAHAGFTIAADVTYQFPWSITSYSDEQLRYLLDSTTMAWKIRDDYYSMGTYAVYVPSLRADNLPKTAFALPLWVYQFLKHADLIGRTRKVTICRVLDWMRHNMVHFQQGLNGLGGGDSYGDYFAVWQYRGYPPLSKIIDGTIDNNNQGMGVQHWTAGCHGSVGFLNAVLRMANIPVQPIWVCGHELACFLTEKMYLDHGDDPYDNNVKSSSQPISKVLIDEATYKSRFTADLTVNITDPQSPACANIGLSAAQFPT